MEEADLLKERLLAITDKRRVQEDIAKKRRQIEEEKLKLQYLKKKSLREQWLMEGLSPQSQEDREARSAQALQDQQLTALLQSNIHSMEEEVEDLESQELSISANEEVILKKLKEVERTADDIIKELNADFQTEPVQYTAPATPPTPKPRPPLRPSSAGPKQASAGEAEPEQAMFAMEISVEKDLRTGESQVVSTASLTVTPQQFRQRGGVKVYDDGRKSVYALRSDSGGAAAGGAEEELSHLQVEEMLRQATDGGVPSNVRYHQPVYAATAVGGSPGRGADGGHVGLAANGRRTPDKTRGPSPFQPETAPEDEAPIRGDGCWTAGPSQLDAEPRDGAQSWGEETQRPPAPGELLHQPQTRPPHQSVGPGDGSGGLGGGDGWRADPGAAQRRGGGPRGPLPLTERTVPEYRRESPLYPAGEASLREPADAPTPDLPSQPVTMIFMGYQTAEEEEEEEEEDFQAELVVVGVEEDDDELEDELDDDSFLSYHPEGCRSQVFQPRLTTATATAAGHHKDTHQERRTDSAHLHSHRPTFSHKPGQAQPLP